MSDGSVSKVKRLVPLVIVLAVAGGWTAYEYWRSRRPYEWSGTIEARTIDVGSRIGGRVKEVLVREGDAVEAGAPLVVLEPGDLDAQRLFAEAQLQEAEATVEKLERGARPEEIAAARARAQTAEAALLETRRGARAEAVAQAEARLRAAEAGMERARLERDRAQQLYVSGAASRAGNEDAEIAYQSAVAQRDAAKEQLRELKNGSRSEEIAQAAARAAEARASKDLVEAGSRAEDLKSAHAQVTAARARLQQIEVQIAELVIRAPLAARVEALDLRPGDILPPNATAATLLEADELYVRIYVPETQLGHVVVGAEVPITVDSFPGESFTGVIEHVAAKGEYSPRNLQTADERADQVFAARVGLRQGKDRLRAGMAAFIQVPR
jgi:multidrug resistance efflux pump